MNKDVNHKTIINVYGENGGVLLLFTK